ncbi:hypothetical protein BU23DRAFT_566945 [Bimuria novae-zelandiae CBS 107.79]|uniref:Uncharacterized protein n=1 Tax=Bimuria novae-zelandiae CBS 107.79 TaxID=1447943 RepID=A0A6A5VCS3_9PLEO|nr:hypothetical protein BU23DRAFT_566945 [Bimuria novae-zelandiae CBS 107.79]
MALITCDRCKGISPELLEKKFRECEYELHPRIGDLVASAKNGCASCKFFERQLRMPCNMEFAAYKDSVTLLSSTRDSEIIIAGGVKKSYVKGGFVSRDWPDKATEPCFGVTVYGSFPMRWLLLPLLGCYSPF